MCVINLLPESEQQRARRSIAAIERMQLFGIALILLSLVSAVALCTLNLREMVALQRVSRADLVEQVDRQHSYLTQINEHKLRHAQLREPCPPSALLSLVSRVIPEGTALNELSFTMPPSAPNTRRREPHTLSLVLAGTTRSHDDLTSIISQLASAGFADVVLEHAVENESEETAATLFRIRASIVPTQIVGVQ